MTCVRCGKILEPGEKFCPACGKAVELPPEPVPVAPAADAERSAASTEALYKAPPQQNSTPAVYKAPAENAAPVKEKEYFGRGALVLCLVVIGILAASTGMFAYLYFSLLGMI